MNRFTSRQKIPPFGETVVYPNFFGKTYSNLFIKICPLLSVRFYSSLHLLFGFQWTFSAFRFSPWKLGGSNSNHSPTYRVLICGALKRFGFDPATFVAWWAQVDSNHRPRAYQARALTTWAMSPLVIRCISYLSPLVEMMGFEPMTPCLQGRCSPNWATPPYFYEVSRSLKIEQHRVNYSA